MAVGRITGPLLASNLARDGVDLAFETDLLYLDVVNGQVGIRQASPQYTLDVNGTLHALQLIVDTTGTIGLMTFTSTTSSSTISSSLGPISIAPSGQENIYLVGNTFVTGDVRATGNFYAQGNIQLGVTTATDTISFGGEINTDLTPFISSGTFVSTVTNTGTTVTNFVTNTSVFSGFNFGSSSSYWASGYFQDLYANTISPADTGTNITMFPNPVTNSKGLPGNALTINGDIRVYGGSPLGTAPVVSNVLYVTMDGNDNNDGRAEDASRACRTIGGAVNSPFYKQGKVIKVRSGHYYENNPIQLLPYTSVIGDDLRTTFIEPLNKTVDLFWVNSGVYIAQMQFRNLRRGEVTRYAPGGAGTYTTGAYCVAFPPRLENPIDLFYSPYIQNCTNQSGPWLKDGTMFVPNQTVQVPNVVATSTYVAGTLTLTVNVVPGTNEMIEIGNTVNGAGILIDSLSEVAMVVDVQNPDPNFRGARDLLENNKAFMVAETIGYITTNNVGFSYDSTKCARDLGLIIDAITHDPVLGGNEQSVAAGLAYWQGNTSAIAGEISTTTSAISYLGTLAEYVLNNSAPPRSYQVGGTVSQYFNTGTTATVALSNVLNCVSIINNIVTNWAGVENAASLLTANSSFIQSEVVAYVNNNFSAPFYYDQSKCSRDTGLIVDSLAFDLLYQGTSQSTFAGIQYWSQNTNTNATIPNEQTTTTNAIEYAKTLALQVVTNSTSSRYQYAVPQVIEAYTGTTATIASEFDLIVKIINSGTVGVTDLIVPNGIASTVTATINTYNLLEANKNFIQSEVVAFVNRANPGFVYNTSTCFRDIGYIVDSVAFDILHGGNRQAIQSGVYYYGYSSTSTVIPNESLQTIAAYNYIRNLVEDIVTATPIQYPYQTASVQNTSLPPATEAEVAILRSEIDLIKNIITNGPAVVSNKTPIGLTASSNPNVVKAFALLEANKDFLVSETIAFINTTFPTTGFQYNQDICYRDVGYIINAVQNDIIHQTNTSTTYAGLQYWQGQYTSLQGEIPQTYYAIEYAKQLAVDVIANVEVTNLQQTGTNIVSQVINMQLPGGSTATTAVEAAFDNIANIVQYGPEAAPVTTNSTLTQFIVVLSTSTVAGATNDKLYFGDTSVYPLQDEQIPIYWTTSTNADRRIDPHGSGGGALVDGNAPSLKSPIQSFVFDAFTQVNQGGNGIHIINKGYAQLVSVFTIFCDVAVHCESGGICSITNSNSNFGDLCLVSEGFGPREFGGTIYNPSVTDYPLGFYPYQQEVQVFVPNPLNRPHISLVMEVIPPETYIDYNGNTVPYVNAEGFPGFLGGTPSMDFLTTGSHIITTNSSTGVVFDTTDIAVGQNVYIVDQYGSQYDNNGNLYLNTNTVVTKVEYQSITLSNPINSGGGQPGNASYFNIYTCGNAYYSILSSVVAPDPKPAGQSNISGQQTETIGAINYINTLAQKVIQNQTITSLQTGTNTSTQVINETLNGSGATSFVSKEINIITDIILTGPNNAPAVTTTGTIVNGATDAATLLELNRTFIQDEVIAYVNSSYVSGGFTYDSTKCARDTGLIVDSLAFDLLYTGDTQSVFAGLQYWSQDLGLVNGVTSEQTTTTQAVLHIANIAHDLMLATTVVPSPGNSTSQVFGTAGSTTAAGAAQSNFNLIANIIGQGTRGITDSIVPNGNASSDATVLNGYNLLVANRQFIIDDTIAWINGNNPGFSYDQTKCRRDIGYMVDSVAFDVLHTGNRQSIQAGTYYYQYDSSSTVIVNETTQTSAAYEFISSILPNIIQGISIANPYQTVVPQVTNLSTGTTAEVLIAQNNINVITNIINNGPSVVSSTYPIGSTASSTATVINAYHILEANRSFIQAETIAWINETYPGPFSYDQRKCHRDVGLIIDAIAADLPTGGNFRAVEAGGTYYSKDGTYHIVTLEENVRDPLLFVDGITVNFYQRSYMSASGYLFEYVGAGTQYGALPQVGKADPVQTKEVIQLNNGKVFFTSTDQNGDFRIGPGLVISQATGVLSGRTFQKSLYAEMTPFILAVEAGSSE